MAANLNALSSTRIWTANTRLALYPDNTEQARNDLEDLLPSDALITCIESVSSVNILRREGSITIVGRYNLENTLDQDDAEGNVS
jgi:hypothetical protein